MINICKQNGKLIKSFKNDDAFNHLSTGELLEDPKISQDRKKALQCQLPTCIILAGEIRHE